MSAPQVTQASVVSASENGIRVDFDQAMQQDAIFYATSSWTVAGHTVLSVNSKLGASVALLELGEEMLTGASISVTVDPALRSDGVGEAMDPFHLSTTFVGEGIAPNCIFAGAVDPRTIQLSFDELLSGTSSVRVSRGSTELEVSSVEVYDGDLILVHLAEEMLDGADHVVRWLGAFDLAGNASTGTRTIVGLGSLPGISTSSLNGRRLTITFSEEMRQDAALRSRFSYGIRATLPGSAAAFVERVVSTSALEVNLDLSEMTIGATYQIVVLGPCDLAGNPMDEGANFDEFVGLGSTPTLVEVRAIGPNLVDAIFSVGMKDNAALRETSRWQFDGGIKVLQVMPDATDRRVVHIAVDGWIPGVEYTLTIDPS